MLAIQISVAYPHRMWLDYQRASLAQVKQLSQRLRERLPRIGSLPPFEPEVDTVENKAGLMEEAKMKDGTSKLWFANM